MSAKKLFVVWGVTGLVLCIGSVVGGAYLGYLLGQAGTEECAKSFVDYQQKLRDANNADQARLKILAEALKGPKPDLDQISADLRVPLNSEQALQGFLNVMKTFDRYRNYE
jgi:hypothetical protein